MKRRIRKLADGLPFFALLAALIMFGIELSGLVLAGAAFVLALLLSWLLRVASGMSWRHALWPPRELGVLSPPSMASVKELALSGRRLQAVKMHRELTGSSLEESLDAVDRMVAEG